MNKKYLVIGDANSMHIYNFVKTVLLTHGFEVYLLTLSINKIRDEYIEFYKKNNIVLYSVAYSGYKDIEKTNRLSRIKNLIRKFKLIKNVPHMDICHIQSVYKTSLIMLLVNRKKFDKVILSYWGGDIEDTTSSLVKLRERCFGFANAITVTVKETYNEFQRIYGHKYDDKLSVCRFATDGLNCIHTLSQKASREECRKYYKLDSDRICITCGYSAYPEQHQDRCLDILMGLDKTFQDKIQVVVPMQYGRPGESYKNRVKNLANKCDFPCTVLEEFVPFEKSAMLAIATDIYLHLRDTDAFSNALKEHIYSGSLVVKGDWLKYPELDEMGAQVKSISSFDELSVVLENVLQDFKIERDIKLFEPMYKLYSTEAIYSQWNRVIDKCILD